MNALGTVYMALAGLALVLAMAHAAQAVLIRSDRTQRLLAALCLSFSVFDLSVAYSSGFTGSPQPAWVGWHVIASASAAALTIIVPAVAWTILEVKRTRAREATMAFTLALAGWRLLALWLVLRQHPAQTWESLHTLEYPWLSLPSVACAVVGAGSWAVEGVIGRRRGQRYSLAMALFGVVAVLGSLQGVAVTLGLLQPPDLFALNALPAMAFVQVLASVRFVQAFQTANQPAGDMARYEVLKKLGEGGMGAIFLARRKGPAGFLRDVVLKQLQASADPMGKERFLVEARLAAQLRHPNIVDVYDLGEQPGGFFIVMEHIQGVTLSDLLRRAVEQSRPIPSEAVAELGLQMCRALSFAHAAGVIHRDIKRQNVMVSSAGVLKLIDFGIAQDATRPLEERPTAQEGAPVASGNLTADNGVIGTFGYIAPERYQGRLASVQSDLFSVGVVLYELLALAEPFQARNALAFIDEVAARRAPKLGLLRSDLSPGLITAIESCLDPEPARRPSSAAELQVLLEHVLDGRRFELGPWVASMFQDGAPVRVDRMPPTTPVQRADLPTAEMKKPAKV